MDVHRVERAAAMMLVAAIVLAACGETSPRRVSKPSSDEVSTVGAVPWSDRTDFLAWKPPVPEPRAPASPCTASDLAVRRIEADGAMQSSLLFVTLAKTSPGICTLAGYPELEGTAPGGERQAVPTEQTSGLSTFQETPATIERHEYTQMTLIYGRNCEAGPTQQPEDYAYVYSDVALVLEDGSTVALDRGIDSACVPGVSRFYRDNAPIEQPVRWGTLDADVTLPESVPSGDKLVYVVTLRNTGGEDLTLSPCGGFVQELEFEDMNGRPLAKGVYEKYRLNCDAEPILAAGATRSYVMELRVPADAPAMDDVRVTWQLIDTSPDQDGQGFVTITR